MANKILGSEVKIAVTVTGIDDNINLSGTEFTAKFYADDKSKTAVLQKAQMLKKDDTTYIAVVDTSLVGVGQLRLELTLYIPDTSCADGNRTEILRNTTDVIIVP